MASRCARSVRDVFFFLLGAYVIGAICLSIDTHLYNSMEDWSSETAKTREGNFVENADVWGCSRLFLQ